MITINLYDYKRVIRDVEIQKRVVLVGAASTATFLACFVVWIIQLALIGITKDNLAEVQIEVAAATPNYNAVQQMKKQRAQYQKIIKGIDQLRSNQARTTEFLEDMGQAVPEGIWLTSTRQVGMTEIQSKRVPFLFIAYDDKKSKRRRPKKKGKEDGADKFIELRGVGTDDQPIVNFLEQLRAIPYIDAVVLNTSQRAWMEKQPVQRFVIYLHFLNTKPAA